MTAVKAKAATVIVTVALFSTGIPLQILWRSRSQLNHPELDSNTVTDRTSLKLIHLETKDVRGSTTLSLYTLPVKTWISSMMSNSVREIRPERLPPPANSSDIYFSLLTVPKFHDTRFSLQYLTWLQTIDPKQVRITVYLSNKPQVTIKTHGSVAI